MQCMWGPKVGPGTHPSPSSLGRVCQSNPELFSVWCFSSQLARGDLSPPSLSETGITDRLPHPCRICAECLGSGFLFHCFPGTGQAFLSQSHLSSPTIPFKECVIYFLDWSLGYERGVKLLSWWQCSRPMGTVITRLTETQNEQTLCFIAF